MTGKRQLFGIILLFVLAAIAACGGGGGGFSPAANNIVILPHFVYLANNGDNTIAYVNFLSSTVGLVTL